MDELANRKRKRQVNIPTEPKHRLMKHLQALFHFISSIDSVNGWFSIKSAIRSGFVKEHEDSNLDKAESFSKGKLETIRKRHSNSLHVQFGNSFVKWFRKIHTDIVSDVLLQSVEVHEAIAEYF